MNHGDCTTAARTETHAPARARRIRCTSATTQTVRVTTRALLTGRRGTLPTPVSPSGVAARVVLTWERRAEGWVEVDRFVDAAPTKGHSSPVLEAAKVAKEGRRELPLRVQIDICWQEQNVTKSDTIRMKVHP